MKRAAFTWRWAGWGVLSVLVFCHCQQEAEFVLARSAPFQDLFIQEEITEQFVNLSTEPFGREDLAFQLLVPKDFRDSLVKISPQQADSPQSQFTPITRQLGPKGHAQIEVQYIQLDLEVGLEDWVTHYLESIPVDLLLRKSRVFNQRAVEDIVVRSTQQGQNYIARMTFSRHGGRIFMVACSSEEIFFNHYTKLFGAAAISFSLDKPPSGEFAEAMTRYTHPDPPRLDFRHPVAWTRRIPKQLPIGKLGVDLSLRFKTAGADHAKTVGFIHIKGALKSLGVQPNLYLHDLKKDFKDAGIEFGTKIRSVILQPSQPAPLNRIEVWSVRVKGAAGEVATLMLENEENLIGLGMLIPVRAQNPFGWMTSWRVFELIIADVKESLLRGKEGAK